MNGPLSAHREIKGSQAFRGVLERRERKEALASRGSPAPQAPKDRRGVSATQVGEPGLLLSSGWKTTDRLTLMAFRCLVSPVRKPWVARRKGGPRSPRIGRHSRQQGRSR